MKYNQKKNQSIETHPEVREMIELADKAFFKAFIVMFKDF